MKKYAKVLGAVFAVFMVLGLAGCGYADQIEELTKKNEELSSRLEELESELQLQNFTAKKEAYAKFVSDNSKVVLDQKYSGGGESVEITSDGTFSYIGWNGLPSLEGDLVGAEIPTGYSGIILYVACTTHVNYGAECYPDYDEDEWEGSTVDAANYGAITHKNCYSAVYIADGDDAEGKTLTMASAVWHPEGEPNGYTTCAKSLNDVKKLFTKLGYDSTCGNYASSLSRNAGHEKIPGILSGSFTLSE